MERLSELDQLVAITAIKTLKARRTRALDTAYLGLR